MDHKVPYRPISCDFYDIIEIKAMRRQLIRLVYKDEAGQQTTLLTTITDTLVEQKEEFIVITDPPHRIRMDHILSIDEHQMTNYC